MPRAAARSAAPHTSSPIAGRGISLVEGAAGYATTNRARCIAPPARAVGRRRRCLFNHAVTALCIAASVTRRNAPALHTADDRAGPTHDRDRDDTRRFPLVGAHTVPAEGSG